MNTRKNLPGRRFSGFTLLTGGIGRGIMMSREYHIRLGDKNDKKKQQFNADL
jgi:hypothetical protein